MPNAIPYHRHKSQRTERERHRVYQRERWDQENQAFYRSKEWRAARLVCLEANPLCVKCFAMGHVVAATVVNHIVDIKDAPERKLDPTNHESLCAPCHNRHTARKQGSP